MGLEADGAIKGCPSLPTADYTGGNTHKRSLREVWNETKELRFTTRLCLKTLAAPSLALVGAGLRCSSVRYARYVPLLAPRQHRRLLRDGTTWVFRQSLVRQRQFGVSLIDSTPLGGVSLIDSVAVGRTGVVVLIYFASRARSGLNSS